MTENDNDNPLYVIRSGGWVFIAGLQWELVESRYRYAARAFARRHDADSFATVPANKNQLLAGIGNLHDAGVMPRETRKSASLALTLLPMLGNHGWGVFELDDGQFWFVAALNGQLSVLSDVVGNKHSIRDAVKTFLSFDLMPQDARTIICPPDFLPDVTADNVLLDNALPSITVPRRARLHPLSNRKALIVWSAILIGVFGGYYAITEYQSLQEAKRIADVRAAFLKTKEQIKTATPAALQPWKEQPVLATFLSTCSAQWKSAPISIAGWRFRTADCTSGSMRLAWSKPIGGTVGDFSRRLAIWYPGNKPLFNIPGGADTGGVALLLAMPLPATPEIVGDADSQTQRLTNYAQQLRAVLNLTEDSASTVKVNNESIPLPWRSFSFTFATDIPPDKLFSPALFDASGIRLTRITVTLNNARLHYSLEGKLYAQ
ncbi:MULTISPECIES: type 4b pilus protein PilO2 [Yersinia]|uniref:PilO protein n=2 Tax=Yersinia TaxID=629 RepID=B7UF85_YERPU|nr:MULTISPECIES: type 4b pilus protein PilO2 [Yersinia]MBO1551365.1 type 4b pilus protein PilO2 [Yersinia pseudotuberculosis]MBO1562445.1 type 4b pilus protein PilO2 [Yersinia pseudotuberculosis]MBO1571418.1 type 4b pilus protein PilO2 [Yersinia pseudotuberculosis]MBO1586370.1 type 4b pilus protein PilO2 [Yersinia pseudotuberculosis]MBO1631804.1 type 4b pilus protein PilO2 [Yersinia pseudotuberculosis]